MDSDDIGDRLRRAAEADPAVLDRVVKAALGSSNSGNPGSQPAAPAPFFGSSLVWPVTLAASVLAAVGVAVWWSATRTAPAPVGVYRVDALPAPDAPRAAESPVTPVAAGVYRVEARLTPAPSRVISVKTDDGTTWILSTGADDDRPPPGTGIVTGEGGTQ